MTARLITYLGITAILFTFTHCGDDDAAPASMSRAMGTLGVTSPTAGSSSRRSVQLMSGTPENVMPLDELTAEVTETFTGNLTEQAAQLGNPLTVTSLRAACYGPSWTDDATGGSLSRPSGDLGIVYATASDTDTTACVAAELNALVGSSPSLANNFIRVQALMLSAAAKAGQALPAIGETQNYTEAMPDISGLTIATASLSRLANAADGGEVYKSLFSITDNSSRSGTITIYHTPTNTANTNFRGLFQAILPQTSSASVSSHRGISLVYEQTDGVLTYSMKVSANRTADDQDFFGTDGTIDFSKASFGEDGHWMLAMFNTNTNQSLVHYAWQAGSSDGSVRAFAINVPAGTSGALTGTGYFGFGASMSSISTSSVPWMTKMYCNWISGGAGGTTQTKVQRQTISESSGIFTVASNNWAFAPTNSCASGSAFTVSSADASFLNGSRTVSSHEMVDPPTTTDVPSITAPTFTIPS